MFRPLPALASVRPVAPLSALTVLVGFLLLLAPASSEASMSVAERRQEVSSLSDSLVRSGRRLAALEQAAAEAASREARLGARIDEVSGQLSRARDRVESARAAAERATRALIRARARLAATVVGIYMGGQSDLSGLLLAGEDFGDLAAGDAYLDAISNSGRQAAERVASLRRERVGSLKTASAESKRVEELLASLSNAREAASTTRSSIESTTRRLTDLRSSRQNRIDRLRTEIDRAEAASATGTGGESYPGGPYSIPTYIVMCESGGNYSAVNPSSGAGGAYQIMPSTWEAYGGQGLPQNAPKAEQDRIAAIIWANDGPGAWTCS